MPTKHGGRVNKQRMEKKAMDDGLKSNMTQEKLQALNSLGFAWAKRKGQVSWEEKYAALQAYHKRTGDCDVPTKYKENPALGRWVSTQRSQYKQFLAGTTTHMTQERFERLNELGFKWNMIDSPPEKK
jgi:Helicase associated domain